MSEMPDEIFVSENTKYYTKERRNFNCVRYIKADRPASAEGEERSCSCHADDNPPTPCPKKYALSDCRKAALTPPPVTEREECARAEALAYMTANYKKLPLGGHWDAIRRALSTAPLQGSDG